jgi:hypothetical protein
MARGPSQEQIRAYARKFYAKVRKAAREECLLSTKKRGENSVIVDTLDSKSEPLRLVFFCSPSYASNGECWLRRQVRVFPHLMPSHLFTDIPWMDEGAPVKDLFAGIEHGYWDTKSLLAYLKDHK